jgi:four helix bundle protein
MLNERADPTFGFERLDAWNRAVEFAGFIYELTKKFPREEVFGLTSQLRRASVSVAANIAEGASRSSGKDQARFFEIAFGSLNEIATMCHIALGQRFVGDTDLAHVRCEVSDIGRMLSGLRRTALDRA